MIKRFISSCREAYRRYQKRYRIRHLPTLEKMLPQYLLEKKKGKVKLYDGSLATIYLDREAKQLKGWREKGNGERDHLLWDLDGRCISDILFRKKYDIVILFSEYGREIQVV